MTTLQAQLATPPQQRPAFDPGVTITLYGGAIEAVVISGPRIARLSAANRAALQKALQVDYAEIVARRWAEKAADAS